MPYSQFDIQPRCYRTAAVFKSGGKLTDICHVFWLWTGGKWAVEKTHWTKAHFVDHRPWSVYKRKETVTGETLDEWMCWCGSPSSLHVLSYSVAARPTGVQEVEEQARADWVPAGLCGRTTEGMGMEPSVVGKHILLCYPLTMPFTSKQCLKGTVSNIYLLG